MTKRYRVLAEGLSYPTDPAVIKRLLAGENLPMDERKMKEPKVGAIVDDIPDVSIAWLLEQGHVERVEGGV